ncbi:hypothetical protein D039_3425B, partial [Vibrio parahaemolyticus EKP-028]
WMISVPGVTKAS